MLNFLARALYLNPIIAWLVTLVGIGLLLLIPISAWRISKHKFPQWTYTSLGVGFGFVVIPLSLWLYMQYYVGPIRALIFGFLGLFMIMAHMAPLTKLTISLLLDATDTSGGAWGAPVLKYAITGGLLWASIYGCLGLVIDLIRKNRSSL
jgi:hypothetical protein